MGVHTAVHLKKFKVITAAHFSADGQALKKSYIFMCTSKLRFRFLLGTASIATVLNSDIPGSKD